MQIHRYKYFPNMATTPFKVPFLCPKCGFNAWSLEQVGPHDWRCVTCVIKSK